MTDLDRLRRGVMSTHEAELAAQEFERLRAFCAEFVWGEDNPAEYESELTKLRAKVAGLRDLCIVFDGPPGPEAGRFVEVEDTAGRGVGLGEWRERDDGLWSLDIRAVLEPPKGGA